MQSECLGPWGQHMGGIRLGRQGSLGRAEGRHGGFRTISPYRPQAWRKRSQEMTDNVDMGPAPSLAQLTPA